MDTDSTSSDSDSDSDSSSLEEERQYQHCRRLKLIAAFTVTHIVATAVIIYTGPFYNKIPYNASTLSGMDWVCELLNSHSECICNELGVHKHVFHGLIEELKVAGHGPSQNVYLEEPSFYTHVSLVSPSGHVCEHFQHSCNTVPGNFLFY